MCSTVMMRLRGSIREENLPRRKAEFIELMECALVSTLPEGPDWTYEVKLDGYRAIGVKGHETILYSRNRKNFNKRFPQITEALADLPADTVIDGEVVALDESGRPDFHRLQHFTAERSRKVSRDGRWLEIFRALREHREQVPALNLWYMPYCVVLYLDDDLMRNAVFNHKTGED